MGFFKFADLANYIQLYFNPNADVIQQYLFSLIFGGVAFLVIFAFQAIALYIIAKREGYKNRWMAFVPFLSTYYIGVCAQKNGVYKAKTQTIALVATIFEILAFILCCLSYYADYTMIVNGYVWLEEQPVKMFGYEVSMLVYNLNPNVPLPENLYWLYWIFEYADQYLLVLLQAVYAVCDILILISFYKTYASKNYFIYVVISVIFPVQGILFFLLRNNKAQNYNDYVMQKQAARYRYYQQYYNNPYNNPYQNWQNGASQHGAPNQNPFDEFGTSGSGGTTETKKPPEDPFDEFN